ncbi:MAG: hypothetical protein IMZ61_04625 [Planctomycetes bacterium]|nr:hypothetical protein [Planctomycetota bacterium]
METVKMPETPDNYEQVARMRYVEGKTWAQIAKSLRLHHRSIERLARRIRKDMHKAIRIMVIVNEK